MFKPCEDRMSLWRGLVMCLDGQNRRGMLLPPVLLLLLLPVLLLLLLLLPVLLLLRMYLLLLLLVRMKSLNYLLMNMNLMAIMNILHKNYVIELLYYANRAETLN